METFEEQLSGGHPNSLGATVEVVEQVLADRSKLEALYACYHSNDEVVRLRTSSAMKRIAQQQPDWLGEYLPRFLTEVASIDQPSTQWTLALLFQLLDEQMTEQQRREAVTVMQRNLAENSDWIVLNNTMQALFDWSGVDPNLRSWLLPHLRRLTEDPRKSVAARARKLLRRAEEAHPGGS